MGVIILNKMVRERFTKAFTKTDSEGTTQIF